MRLKWAGLRCGPPSRLPAGSFGKAEGTTGECVCISYCLASKCPDFVFLSGFVLKGLPCCTKLLFHFVGRSQVSTFFRVLLSTWQALYWDRPRESTHLIQTKKPQVPKYIQGTDPGSCGDLSSYLQANLYYLQWISKDDLRAASLQARGGRDRSRFPNQRPTGVLPRKVQKTSTGHYFTAPSSQGNESPTLRPMLEGLPGMIPNSVASQSMFGFALIWNIKGISQTSLSRVNPALSKMAKLINAFGKQSEARWGRGGAPQLKGKRW